MHLVLIFMWATTGGLRLIVDLPTRLKLAFLLATGGSITFTNRVRRVQDMTMLCYTCQAYVDGDPMKKDGNEEVLLMTEKRNFVYLN